ncbi:response regulator transcription factor [Achromobacter denitrificans]|uniref:Response regulator transcription factor n=2 Tax=Achromobacter denitrificans TaxID=32002 RepID=A0A6N0JT96_ACHDE|nr:response regulator transcription factor [Achromobacter denitrificans]MBV2156821.1 response regulator transcription factor [Achromobacter denitrificans]MDF3862071.1 response regulator transcription factor [Achromobacter denitrificans]MDX3882554.1 response regulator transcription factor [Achromobacter sp.]QKQ50429.1 response regulator transcription factor [Achromobacter denitrificans]
MNQLRILMMSPDETARAAAVSALLQAGISARGCSTSLELFGLLNGGAYDVVVLDVGTLGEIGYALVARLHGSSSLGIVVMGNNMSVDTRLRCLQSGADACLPEPQDPRELACILLSLARRLPAAQDAIDAETAANGQWELRDQGWTLAAPTGTTISLSANERLIVRSLLEVAGRAVGRSELGEELQVEGGNARASGSRSIDVIVSRLRRKAELAGLILPIRTVYGSGYLFADQ